MMVIQHLSDMKAATSGVFVFIPWLVQKPVKRRGFGKCAISQKPATFIPMGHMTKARFHTDLVISPNSANHWGMRNNSACDLVISGPQWLLHWELCNFSLNIGSCYNIHSKPWHPLSAWDIIPVGQTLSSTVVIWSSYGRPFLCWFW